MPPKAPMKSATTSAPARTSATVVRRTIIRRAAPSRPTDRFVHHSSLAEVHWGVRSREHTGSPETLSRGFARALVSHLGSVDWMQYSYLAAEAVCKVRLGVSAGTTRGRSSVGRAPALQLERLERCADQRKRSSVLSEMDEVMRCISAV